MVAIEPAGDFDATNCSEYRRDFADYPLRCIFGRSGGQSVSSRGNTSAPQKRQNPRAGKGFDAACRSLATNGKMEAAGIEPASRDISMPASTCVVGSFTLLAGRSPTDGVPG